LFRKKARQLNEETLIEKALQYPKNRKAASVDFIAAKLLKNGESNLADALHIKIQQAWTSKTLPRSWTEGVLCKVYKKADKTISRDLPLETDTQSLRQNSIRQPLIPRPFSITRLGSNQVNQQQTNSLNCLNCAKFLEKNNEFNITTHHLFIDFKARYDTIIRNEVHVGMSELNFPKKLIRLTKSTLTIVTCCVNIQNDCSQLFEIRQGLRQEDVLSTLFFNVVLQVIVRRAKLQATGTIYRQRNTTTRICQ
jgi:hypothetical protein